VSALHNESALLFIWHVVDFKPFSLHSSLSTVSLIHGDHEQNAELNVFMSWWCGPAAMGSRILSYQNVNVSSTAELPTVSMQSVVFM
jgi:hypothetical protein